MFYEYPRGAQPLTPAQAERFASHPQNENSKCEDTHRRRDRAGMTWNCSLARGHEGSHLAVVIGGAPAYVCAFWDHDRSTDGNPVDFTFPIRSRVHDFSSPSEGNRRQCRSTGHGWGCTLPEGEGHGPLHVGGAGTQIMGVWPVEPAETVSFAQAFGEAGQQTGAAEPVDPWERPALAEGRVVRALAMYPGYNEGESAVTYAGRLGVAINDGPDSDGDIRVAFFSDRDPIQGGTGSASHRHITGPHYYVREWEVLTDEEVRQAEAARTGQTPAEPETTVDDPAAALAALWEALGAEANERGWCSEYDDFAAKHGGPRRPARFYVTVNLAFRIAASAAHRVLEEVTSNTASSGTLNRPRVTYRTGVHVAVPQGTTMTQETLNAQGSAARTALLSALNKAGHDTASATDVTVDRVRRA